MYKGYAVSIRGASHEDAAEVCQDSARIYIAQDFAVAAVSDGHGSEKHFRSAAGSEMATRVAIRSVCDFYERNGGLDGIFFSEGITVPSGGEQLLLPLSLCGTTSGSTPAGSPENAARRIAANIICGWNSEIAAHIGFSPLSEQEKAISDKYGGIANEIMYGATLIVAVLTPKGCFGLQIGDGSFVAGDEGGCFSPMPEDAKLMGNLTTSLCDSDAISSFRWFYRAEELTGIMLSSDGLLNSFRCEEDFFRFGGRVLGAVADDNTAFLPEHLKNRSRNGSRDDISVAALIKENRKDKT